MRLLKTSVSSEEHYPVLFGEVVEACASTCFASWIVVAFVTSYWVFSFPAAELFLHTLLTEFLLKPRSSLGLEEISTSATIDLTDRFRLKQTQPFCNLSFNLRIVRRLQSPSQQCPSLFQTLVSKNLDKNVKPLTRRLQLSRQHANKIQRIILTFVQIHNGKAETPAKRIILCIIIPS